MKLWKYSETLLYAQYSSKYEIKKFTHKQYHTAWCDEIKI